jgi:hypothetical protein
MGTPDSVAAKVSKAVTDEYEKFVAGLSPENRVAFRQANLARVQAEAAYEDAKRAAEEERLKPARAFEAAREAYNAAVTALMGNHGAVDRAEGILNRLEVEARDMKAGKLIDPDRPDEGKRQVATLQGTLDEYKASVAAVAAQKQLVVEAALALQKLSDPQDGTFKPDKAIPNKAAQRIADEQKELAIAQAHIPYDAAMDAFDLKKAELEGSPARRMQ